MLSPKVLRSVSAALVLVMGGGCASTPDGRKTQAQGTAIGAVLGAAVGGAIGYAAGGRSGLARGAAIGGGAGAVAGFAYGTHVAKRKSEYASREAWLDACIASAHRVNSNAYAYSRTLEGRIARLESRTRAARASGIKSEARAMSEGRGARNYGGLKSEVSSLQETKGTLGRQVNRLAGLENQLDV
jgi:hypothetical protein